MLAAGGEGFCTAFAVRPNILATNAHCVFAARRHVTGVVALENEGRAQVSYSVSDMKVHPGYRDSDANALTPDVGIVTISGKSAVVLELAARDELTAAGAGDDVYMIGFPGRLMDASNPAATFLAAHIGRITNSSAAPAPTPTTGSSSTTRPPPPARAAARSSTAAARWSASTPAATSKATTRPSPARRPRSSRPLPTSSECG